MQSPFPAVVCGIDGTREAFEAARQGARVAGPGGRLLLLSATHLLDAVAGRWGPELIIWDLVEGPPRELSEMNAAVRGLAERSLAWAERQTAGVVAVETHVVSGRAHEELASLADREGAGLIAVGAHGGRRLTGAALGSVATMLLHESPAAVLVARSPFDPGAFPSRVAVGVDGSPEGLRALEVAARLCADPATDLTAVIATRGEDVDPDAVARAAAPHRVTVERRRPVDALVDAASRCDLLVVGSRGVGGLRALGSVSERVAHRAASSVLVVRG